MSPAVSIILPTYNRLHYAREAIASVLAQTFTDWQLVVADDGSGEEMLAYLASMTDPRIGVIRLAHTGNPSAVRNAALRVARGRYIAFLDSDDLWLPQKLAVQVTSLLTDTQRRWSYSAIVRIDSAGKVMAADAMRRWIPYEGHIVEQLLTLQAGVATPTVVAERALIEQAGLFDEQQLYFEEYDLWLRLNLLSEVGVIKEPLALVRSHQEHYTSDRIRVYEARTRLLEKVKPLATGARWRRALRAERATNVACLANAYARRGQRWNALRTLLCGSGYLGRASRTWRQAAGAAGRALLPLGRG
jgi:glycosyltransferase involved in cell wall biosynthesis